MSKNYYDILGVKKDATQDEIKKAYRKMAIEHHPDKGGDENKFKEAAEAYEILSDSQKKQEYDMFGSSGGGQRYQSHGFNMEDIFSQFGDIFGSGFSQHYQRSQPKRGRDLRVQVQLTLEDVVFGTTKKIKYQRNNKCSPCDGRGGTDVRDCLSCNGSGHRTVSQQTPFGRIQQTAPCNNCSGSGKNVFNKCSSCEGEGVLSNEESIDINIPAGVGNGMNMTMQGYGNYIRDGIAGDLQVLIQEIPHSKFSRQGNDLYCQEWISISDAVLGTHFEVETPRESIKIKVDPGTESGKVFTINSKGVPNLASNGRSYGSGDLHIQVNVKIPKDVSTQQKEIFEKLKSLTN